MPIIKPTSLTDSQITEFQSLYKKYYYEDLSKIDAEEQGLRLMRFIAEIIEDNPVFCNYRQII